MVNLFDTTGQRKYLNRTERNAFFHSLFNQPREVRTFCMVLYYTGCRISEALALTPQRIDFEECTLIFESLKKRQRGIFRSVPVPDSLIDTLDLVHGLREMTASQKKQRLWNWSRMTAWRKIKAVMAYAGISGIKATPKGLRHAFGIAANQKGIQLNMVQKWLGHADIKTTAIYSQAIGVEERNLAKRLWEDESVDI
jgi:integrase|tara:strand:- start:105 stop:695 length:591 start_codon:yes stop_codon:yes gene_type:complete